MNTTDITDKTTEPSKAVLVDRAYDLGITIPKSWNKAKIEKAIAEAEAKAAEVATPEPEKAPETPAEAPSTDAKDSKKESSAKGAGKPAAPKPEPKPEYAIERLYTDTRAYDVLSRSERMVTVRYRPATEEVTRREEDGSGFPRVWRATVSDDQAPTYRLRLRKDGTYRMDSWSNPFTFTDKAPEAYTDYRV